MKSNKHNKRGMTLVEVIIAMSIFAIVAGCVLTAIAGAMQQTTKNRKRDIELGAQMNAVGKFDTAKGSTNGGYTVSFKSETVGVSDRNQDSVSLYVANLDEWGSDFGFTLKGVNGGATFNNVTIDPDTSKPESKGQYKFVVEADPTLNLDVKVVAELNNTSTSIGYIYEGSTTTGYTHSSHTYTRLMPSSGNIQFGYFNESPESDSIHMRVYINGNVKYDKNVTLKNPNDLTRIATFTCSETGVSEPVWS